MTFRAKPVVKRDHRPAWETQDRRNFYLNLGFGLIVLLALVILAIAAGLNYYNEHLASVGSVDGQSISKDELRDRVQVDSWRLDEADRRVSTAVLAGHLSEAQGQSQQETITQQRNQLTSTSLERLIDSKLQAKLAGAEGVAVAPDEVDARLTKEATTPESRHAWLIEVKPVVDLGSLTPTPAQKTAAKAKADAALKDLQSGKAWEDVAKTVSTDASTAPQSGDLGWIEGTGDSPDPEFLKALFATAVNTPTAVVEGADGTYRIGRVSEIAPESVDTAYQAKIVNDGVSLDRYRSVLAADVLHDKLQAKVVGDVTGPSMQRHVSEIYAREAAPNLGSDAIKVRHILYAPKDDPSGAANLSPDDPAWEAAHSQALATWTRLKNNPSLFDPIARTDSDEGQAQGPTGSGGKLPFFDSKSSVDDAFKAAILAPGVKDGQILEPVKSAFGWHVIQAMYRPTDADHFKALKTQAESGTDFGILARDTSEAPTAGTGGDMGWIAKGQLDDKLTDAIFATPIGKTSEVIEVAGDGTYLFKVLAEENRKPEGKQLDELTSTAFSKWYDAKKTAAAITRDASITGTTTD
ncbi:MAG: peptidylprolyl isomerase [Chloroflexota bacterium]